MTVSQDTIAILILSAVGAVLWFFAQSKLKKLDQVDSIATDWKLMAKDMQSISDTLKEAKPKLDSVAFLEKRMDAAFRIIDEQKVVVANTEKEIAKMRERIHDQASKIMILIGKCERTHGEVSLKPKGEEK